METFLARHKDKITGVIGCFDRLLFKGHLPLTRPEVMTQFLDRHGLLIKDFKNFVLEQSTRVKDHAKAMAERSGRPYIYLQGAVRKDDLAQEIAEKDGLTHGLVCILATVETGRTFKVTYGQNRPRLASAPRPCLCLYFYIIDREFGLMHIRLQTWFPFTMQFYINGHEWLARKMEKADMEFRKLDNVFLSIEDPARAQRFADRFVHIKWPRIFTAMARRVNPLLRDLLAGMEYYWVVEQAEYAHDVMFTDRAALGPLYDKLAKHAALCFSAEDVLGFLGKKLHANYKGEVLTDYGKRFPGVRVKHRMGRNGIKMYDKQGSVLRVETTINHPKDFKVYREGRREGERVKDWFPMCKGVAYFYRYAEVARAANTRYLEALAGIPDPAEARRELHSLASPVREKGRSHRGFNPALERDVQLFTAALRGEHAIQGFRNKDIRRQIFGADTDADCTRRRSAAVSCRLRNLHVHGLIARIPRSRRWRTTKTGQVIMSVVVKLHGEQYPDMILAGVRN
jgi:hypothetical protein